MGQKRAHPGTDGDAEVFQTSIRGSNGTSALNSFYSLCSHVPIRPCLG